MGPGVFRPEAHDVTIDKRLLRQVCAPVHLPRTKIEVTEVAEMLGTCDCRIRTLIRKGVFAVRRVKGLSGRHGPPVPLIGCPWPLDPSANNLQPPDPLWAHHWPILVSHVPDEFEQTLTRVPRFTKKWRRYLGWDWLCPGCRKTVDRLYYPLPAKELVLLQVDGVERDEVDELPSYPPTFACKQCHGVWFFSRVDATLKAGQWGRYIAYVSGGLLYGHEVSRPPDYALAPPHLEIDPSAMDPQRMAPRIPARKRPYRSRPRPAPRRDAVIKLLLRGFGTYQIARELGMAQATVDRRLDDLRKLHRKKNRKALYAMLRKKHPQWAPNGPQAYHPTRKRRNDIPHKRLAVLKLLLAGYALPAIAAELGLTLCAVYSNAWKLYKQHGVHSRQELLALIATWHGRLAHDPPEGRIPLT